MKQKIIDRDKLNMASKDEVAKATVRLFDRIQSLPKEIQLLALAAAFVLMSETYQFPTNDTYSAVKRLMRDKFHSERVDHRFAAMKFHLKDTLSDDAKPVS